LKHRRNFGEKLSLESPLIREHFKDGSPKTNFPRHISASDVNHSIHAIAKRGAKTVNLAFLQPDHGLRKRFSNCIERCNLKDTVADMLIGHMNMRIKHYNDHDYRIAEHRQKNLPYVMSEFKKAIDELTIDENYKLKKDIKILKEKVADQPKIEELKEMVEVFRNKIDYMELTKNRDRQELQKLKDEKDAEFRKIYEELQWDRKKWEHFMREQGKGNAALSEKMTSVRLDHPDDYDQHLVPLPRSEVLANEVKKLQNRTKKSA
jgi:hypothetical protein